MSNKLQLLHKLKNRHLQMIALGGAIGTGLFFGSAKSIHATGPSIVLSYLLGGLVIYIILRALGEMTVDSPSPGAFSQYAHTYVGHYAGFILGWSAWFEYAIVCMVELTAVTVFFDYFVPGIPHWILCLFILIFFTAVNLINVRLFGEFEFWFASIKIVTIGLMLLFSVYLLIFKHMLNPEISQYANLNMVFAGGFQGFVNSLVMIVFAFGGSEFVSIAAGEAQNPAKSVPTAINGIIVRIVLFYILTMLAILLLYPYQKLSTNISPFVDVFNKIGFSTAAGIINLVAITAALSVFNSCLYAASRMLFNLATNSDAPKYLAKLQRDNHIPRTAILFTSMVVLLAVVVNYLFPEQAIMYLLTIATGAILIIWIMILITQICFRKNKVANQVTLKYKLILFPYTSIFAMTILIGILIAMTQIDEMRFSIFVTPLWIFMLTIFYVLHKHYKNR